MLWHHIYNHISATVASHTMVLDHPFEEISESFTITDQPGDKGQL